LLLGRRKPLLLFPRLHTHRAFSVNRESLTLDLHDSWTLCLLWTVNAIYKKQTILIPVLRKISSWFFYDFLKA
jgi:hypothetical protein